MIQTIVAAVTVLSVSAGGDIVGPSDVVDAMRACVPIIQVDQAGDSVLFHVDTAVPSGGQITWSSPERLDHWESYTQPRHPDIVLLFAKQPEPDPRAGIRENRDRIAACFNSLTI